MAQSQKKSQKKLEADFGFQRVAEEEKAKRVHSVFSSVAGRYDLMNDLMSAGLHRWWKARMVEKLRPFDRARLLDVAGGTGDIAFRFLERAQAKNVLVDVTISDVNEDMLEEGRVRAVDRGIVKGINWKVADAENLPFEDGSFDYCTIAFGIRNVTHINKVLAEMYRVLKPGGRFVCLEFSHVDNPALAQLYDIYSFHIIPQIGQMVTGDREAYQYLVESIRKFPRREEFSAMMEGAGFTQVTCEPMTQGVVALHSGWHG